MRSLHKIKLMSLLTFGALLLGGFAIGQDTTSKTAKTTQPETKQPKDKASDDKDKALSDLKKAVSDLQTQLQSTEKSLTELKSASANTSSIGTEAKAALKTATAAATQAETASKTATGAEQSVKDAAAQVQSVKTTAEEAKAAIEEVKKNAVSSDKVDGAQSSADTAWMLVSSAFVMFMLPGLALFYGGMVRRKNILATMMQSMAALSIVGLYWVAIGYSLAFGPSVAKLNILGVEDGGLIGWSTDLFFLQGIGTDQKLPNATIPVYVHVMFQGMFAIITPALISGALAERIRFWPFCLFSILWVTFVYCPLAHMVWAFDWFAVAPAEGKKLGETAIGLLGKMGALDFAGGTVVHIAAGMAGLAAALVLRKRYGYPKAAIHPSSMVLTLLGAGFLWFGWFGFNGGSAGGSNPLAASAFAATQAAAAAAGLGWIVVEFIMKGKPTALGLASGIVAGLVAVTPASGYVYIWGGVLIGLAASVICYFAVALKNKLGYDDSLDAFGVHGVGGFIGAVLTGLFCYTGVNSLGADGYFAIKGQKSRVTELEQKLIPEAEKAGKGSEEKLTKLKEEQTKLKETLEKYSKDDRGPFTQLIIQLKAALFAVVFATILSLVLAALTHGITLGNFTTTKESEVEGLDRTEHGEVGFDFGYATETVSIPSREPRAATAPKGNGRFELSVEGVDKEDLLKKWTSLCQPSETAADPDFLAVYPNVTTISGNRFRCRGGDPTEVANRMEKLLKKMSPGLPVKVSKV